MVFLKPEGAVKRVDELVAIGQKQTALSNLHETLLSKRFRYATAAQLEPVMLKLAELCVELRKSKIAKEALHFYKNWAQNNNVTSIQTVLKYFLELAQQKVSEASANQELEDVDDLEAIETPESLLLHNNETHQVTSAVKFLWESYRTILDLLRNNNRLEVSYGIDVSNF